MKLDSAGWPFIAGLAAATIALLLSAPIWALIPAALLLFTLNFFRDPERHTPDEPGAVISPADGRILVANSKRVSIFMNVFDVHVCRSPVAGRVTTVSHEPGRFLAAMKDEASEQNERTTIVVASPGGVDVRFVLVAGLVARRIVCRVAVGTPLSVGDRVGIIRFGSRVDVDLPAGAEAAVAIGERVVAGETVVARLGQRRA